MAITPVDTEVNLVINNVPDEETLLAMQQGGLLQANQLYNTPDNSAPIQPVIANPSGTASIDLTKIQIDGTNYNIAGGASGNYEETSNKVTSISSSSTDIQYPSAKCVYDNIENVREIAEGKTASYVCSDVTNVILNSQNDTITISSSLTDINSETITLSTFNIGDIVYVTETDVPDRWVGAINVQSDVVQSVVLYKLETSKVPVTDVQVNGSSVVNNSVASIDLSGYVQSSSLATVATSGSYNDLTNTPTIPTVNNATLTIQKNGTTIDTFTANASSDVTVNVSVPTKISDLTNDSTFMTNPMIATNDIIIGGIDGVPTRLAKGSNGQVVGIDSNGNVAYINQSGGGGGTTVVANPTLIGTEALLTSIGIASVNYKIPQAAFHYFEEVE